VVYLDGSPVSLLDEATESVFTTARVLMEDPENLRG
jgi:hypothetical protein